MVRKRFAASERNVWPACRCLLLSGAAQGRWQTLGTAQASRALEEGALIGIPTTTCEVHNIDSSGSLQNDRRRSCVRELLEVGALSRDANPHSLESRGDVKKLQRRSQR